MLSRSLVRPMVLLCALSPALADADELLRGSVESLRDSGTVYVRGAGLMSGHLIADFYAARHYRPAWDPQRASAFLAAIDDSGSEGLNPADFGPERLRPLATAKVLGSALRAKRIAADLILSDALLRYVLETHFGRLDPVEVDRAWNHRPPIDAKRLVSLAVAAVESPDPRAKLTEQAPRPFFYEALRRALVAQQAGTQGGPQASVIPEGKPLSMGSRDARVAALRERLVTAGYLKETQPADPALFDNGLREALVAYQGRNGLEGDGVAGPGTLRLLNGGALDPAKIEKIRINMERMRWFYDDLPPDYVLVDVAGFMVHVIRGGKIDWSTRVVVGTRELQTPSFRDEMEHLIFNPTWTVPPSIQKKMRGVGRQFKLMDRRTGRAVSGGNVTDYRRYKLVQPAGPKNALGQVKFMFPNGQAVYLHDTPSKGLFGSSVRAYSHGCVRVQNPLKLAEVILDSPRWDQSQIHKVVATNQTHYVFLEKHLPVILYYLTAIGTQDGALSFRGDIYGRDSAVSRALAGPPSPPRIAFPKPVTLPAAPLPSPSPASPGDSRHPGTTLTLERQFPHGSVGSESPALKIATPPSASADGTLGGAAASHL